jgi:hypothetical protein
MLPRFPRLLFMRLLAVAGSWLGGCLPPQAPSGPLVLLPAADSTLIEVVSSDSLQVRIDEPGYVVVFAVSAAGALHLAHPAPKKPAAHVAAPTAVVPLWHPRTSSRPPSDGTIGGWPSEQMCGAEPTLCSQAMARVFSSPAGATAAAAPDPTYSYVVIITAAKPDLNLFFRRFRYPEPPPRGKGIARGLAEQVAAQVPILRWAEF